MLPTNTISTDEKLKAQVIGPVPDWGMPALTDLLTTLTSRDAPFPCTFAVSAARRSALRFGFVEDLGDPASWEVLPSILLSYLRVYQQIARETSLIVTFGREERVADLADYHRTFWNVLQFLHKRDPEPWPSDIPQRTDDPRWEFSFGGTPIFVVCNSPAHMLRRSRSSPHFMITFQPRWVFADLDAHTARGANARRIIRERLRAFDGAEPSTLLGNYGDPDNREWRQYFMPDDNVTLEQQCPFQHG